MRVAFARVICWVGIAFRPAAGGSGWRGVLKTKEAVLKKVAGAVVRLSAALAPAAGSRAAACGQRRKDQELAGSWFVF